MVRSRSASILTIGPQAKRPRTTSSTRNVMPVQSVRPGLMSAMPPAARTGVRVANEVMATCSVCSKERSARAERCLDGLREGEEQADDDREERRAFDEGGRDDHRGADVAGGGRLAGGALHRGGGEAADAEAGAEDGEAGAEAGGQEGESDSVHGFFSCLLACRAGLPGRSFPWRVPRSTTHGRGTPPPRENRGAPSPSPA